MPAYIKYLLQKATPYANLIRLNKQIGTLLVFLPCLIGLAYAKRPAKISLLEIIFWFIASFLARSGGCILNDIADKNIDNKVARTKNRPLAQKQISLLSAIAFLIILSFFGMAIFFSLNGISQIIILLFTPLIIFYPYAKRYFPYPQLILGLIFNIGLLVAFFNHKPESFQETIPLISLYFSLVMWTLAYDTIYAYQDIQDDSILGLNSTAVRSSKYSPRAFLGSIYLLMIIFLFIFYVLAKLNIFFLVTIIFITLLCGYFILAFNAKYPQRYQKLFQYNLVISLLILWGVMIA